MQWGFGASECKKLRAQAKAGTVQTYPLTQRGPCQSGPIAACPAIQVLNPSTVMSGHLFPPWQFPVLPTTPLLSSPSAPLPAWQNPLLFQLWATAGLAQLGSYLCVQCLEQLSLHGHRGVYMWPWSKLIIIIIITMVIIASKIIECKQDNVSLHRFSNYMANVIAIVCISYVT